MAGRNVIPGLRRRLAVTTCRVLRPTLPARLRPWADAVEAEVAEIGDDGKALAFALGSLCGLLPRALGFQLTRLAKALTGINATSKRTFDMGIPNALRHPLVVGIACATGAVVLGLFYMAPAGASSSYLRVNAAALMIGVLAIGILRTAGAGRVLNKNNGSGGVSLALALLLLATALLGESADGATRWVSLAGLSVQPSLILLPAMIVVFARSQNTLSTVALVMAATALALQPDRGMAGMLTASMAALALLRPDRPTGVALACATVSFAVTLARPDLLPASPYVEQVLYSSFDVHMLAGLAVLGGSLLLILPAILGVRNDPAHRHVHVVFGAAWLSAVAAAALGNYPTPLVGYGGSAILGYVLSLAVLPGATRSAAVEGELDCRADAVSADQQLRAVLVS